MRSKPAKLEEGSVLSFEWRVGAQHINFATKFGNSAHVLIPKEWLGQEVLCILKKTETK